MDKITSYHFDTDIQLLKLRLKLRPGQRIQALLDTHEFQMAIIRGRLRQRYPQLSNRELNLKVLEEIERVKKLPPPPDSFLRHSE